MILLVDVIIIHTEAFDKRFDRRGIVIEDNSGNMISDDVVIKHTLVF